MMFKVVMMLGLSALVLGQEDFTQMVEESEPQTVTPGSFRSSILRELPKPFVAGEFPHYYHPYRYNAYHPYYHRNHPNAQKREDGTGVAVHPGGATSYIFPQVHGIGKRSTTDVSEVTPLSIKPWRSYRFYDRYNGHYHPYSQAQYGYYRHPYYQAFNPYRRVLKRSPTDLVDDEIQYNFDYPSADGTPTTEFYSHPSGSVSGYSYRW